MDRFEPLGAPRITPEREIFTVSRLNREARLSVEASLGVVWVEGEVSNLARPGSGHLYWTLKDENAQLRCAMFRPNRQKLDFELANGQQILLRGRVSIYEVRGEFQLVAEFAEPAGVGLLRRRFEQLKHKLGAEGLFDASRKRPLPPLPTRIGVVTSPTGAAVRDVLTVLRRRFPAVRVLIYPTAVQGERAAEEIAAALALADRRHDCDLLILTRGGGSLEDLWAFNEEIVARALADCGIPVIVGVGHEVDFTIADFVADQRAPTPSGAAELAVPDRSHWIANTALLAQRLCGEMRRRFRETENNLTHLRHRLARVHPGVQLQQAGQRLDELDARMRRQIDERLRDRRAALLGLVAALRGAAPRVALSRLGVRMQWCRRTLAHAMREQLERRRTRLAGVARALQSVSPLATLERGYAIVTAEPSGRLLTDTRSLRTGSLIRVQLHRGRLTATVESKDDGSANSGDDAG